jgi:hypothetical protein
MFLNEGKAIESLAYKILGKERKEHFYNTSHHFTIEQYLKDCNHIYNDKANDKTNRYFNTSILFMQKFLSELVALQNNEIIKDESMNSSIELKRLEKRILDLEKSNCE